MVEVIITTEVIEWLQDELGITEDAADEFARMFISILRVTGGLKVRRRSKPRPDKFHPVDVAILGGDPSL